MCLFTYKEKRNGAGYGYQLPYCAIGAIKINYPDKCRELIEPEEKLHAIHLSY